MSDNFTPPNPMPNTLDIAAIRARLAALRTFGVIELAQSGSAHELAVVVEGLPSFKWYDGPGAMPEMFKARTDARLAALEMSVILADALNAIDTLAAAQARAADTATVRFCSTWMTNERQS